MRRSPDHSLSPPSGWGFIASVSTRRIGGSDVSDSSTREFSLGAIVSVTHGCMLSPRGAHEVYDLVFHLTYGPDAPAGQYPLHEEQFHSAAESLARHFPWIEHLPLRAGVDFHHVSVADWARLDRWEQQFGAKHAVTTSARGNE